MIKLSFYCLETLRELRLSANFQTRKLCENNGILRYGGSLGFMVLHYKATWLLLVVLFYTQ